MTIFSKPCERSSGNVKIDLEISNYATTDGKRSNRC